MLPFFSKIQWEHACEYEIESIYLQLILKWKVSNVLKLINITGKKLLVLKVLVSFKQLFGLFGSQILFAHK